MLGVTDSLLWIGIFPWEIAEKWDQITHILEREFQETLRAQVGTTIPRINSSNKMESFKTFTGAGIIAQCKMVSNCMAKQHM